MNLTYTWQRYQPCPRAVHRSLRSYSLSQQKLVSPSKLPLFPYPSLPHACSLSAPTLSVWVKICTLTLLKIIKTLTPCYHVTPSVTLRVHTFCWISEVVDLCSQLQLFTFLPGVPELIDWLCYNQSFSDNFGWLFSLSLLKVFESFVDYVAVEQLDGDNKYDAGEHGLQVTWRLCASVPLYLSTLFSHPLLNCELSIHLYLFTCRWCLERKRILFLSGCCVRELWSCRWCRQAGVGKVLCLLATRGRTITRHVCPLPPRQFHPWLCPLLHWCLCQSFPQSLLVTDRTA